MKGFASRPFEFLVLLEKYGLLPFVLPEIEAMRGVEQPVEFHPEGDVLAHTLLTLSEAQQIMQRRNGGGNDVLFALATLLHDVGKPLSAIPHPKYDRPCFFGHEETGERTAIAMMAAWGIPEKISRPVGTLVRSHMIPGQTFTERTAVKLVRRMGTELAERLFELALCDTLGTLRTGDAIHAAHATFRRAVQNLENAERGQTRLLDGNEVMAELRLPPGPSIGRILENLDVAVAEGHLRTRDEALLWLREQNRCV